MHGPPKEEKAKLLSQIEYAEPGSAAVKLGFDSAAQRIWATQADMGAMFGVDVSVISRHLRNIFNEGELAEELHLQKMQISGVHPRAVSFYSLDVIISVGYRVNSKRATAFRQWATRTLRTYLEHGYVINEKLLRDSPEKLNQLAASVRALRSSEKQIYSKVRECFKNLRIGLRPAGAGRGVTHYVMRPTEDENEAAEIVADLIALYDPVGNRS